MKTIWKYPIPITDNQTVMMPKGSEILCVRMQGDGPCLWAVADPNAPKIARQIQVVGTGHPLLNFDDLIYIGTFQTKPSAWTDALVFHVFEVL